MRPVIVAATAASEAVDAGEEIEVLPHAQVAVERELLGHVAQPRRAPRTRRGTGRSPPPGRARRRPQQAAHHLERGRLAGAVGPEQAEDLAAADAERDPIGRGEVAELLGQPAGLDDRARSSASARAGPASGDSPFGPPPSRSTKASSNRGGDRLELEPADPERRRVGRRRARRGSPGGRCSPGSRRRPPRAA